MMKLLPAILAAVALAGCAAETKTTTSAPTPTPPPAEAQAAAPSGPTRNVTIALDGLGCPKCAGKVEKALRAVPGVSKAQVDSEKKEASVQCAETVKDESLTKAIEAIEGEEFKATVKGA